MAPPPLSPVDRQQPWQAAGRGGLLSTGQDTPTSWGGQVLEGLGLGGFPPRLFNVTSTTVGRYCGIPSIQVLSMSVGCFNFLGCLLGLGTGFEDTQFCIMYFIHSQEPRYGWLLSLVEASRE